MRSKDLLFGTNYKCRQCTKECKQWEQIKVVFCPFFESILSKKKIVYPLSTRKS